jgi:hypothetical protein
MQTVEDLLNVGGENVTGSWVMVMAVLISALRIYITGSLEI